MQPQTSQPLFVRIADLVKGKLFGNAQPAATTTPTTPPPVTYSARGQTFNPDDVAQLKKIIFSEVSNRDVPKKTLEANVIFNTALNRMAAANTAGQKRSLSQVLTQPNQYQGYNSPLYQRYDNPGDSLTAARKQQTDSIVDDMVKQVQGGNFKDNTNGAYYYKHVGDKIYYDDKKPLFANQ